MISAEGYGCGPGSGSEMTEEYVIAAAIHFSDGGLSECMKMGQGTLRQCERIRDMVPAVATSSGRPISGAELIIMTNSEWNSLGKL